MSLGNVPGAMHAITTYSARCCPGEIAVPDMIRQAGHRQAFCFVHAIGTEQAEFHALRMLGKNREIDPFPIPLRTEGVMAARQQYAHCAPPYSNNTVASGGTTTAIDHARPWLG